MKFVENNQADIGQFRVLLDAAGENALGYHLDAGTGGDLAVKADAITNGSADFLAEQRAHSGCRRPGGEPPRFQHDDFFTGKPWLVQQGKGHAGGFTGAGRGAEHNGPMRQGGAYFRKACGDGQGGKGLFDCVHGRGTGMEGLRKPGSARRAADASWRMPLAHPPGQRSHRPWAACPPPDAGCGRSPGSGGLRI